MNFINPKTGRTINEKSRGFKNILTEFNINNNLLEPKNKSNYIFSKDLMCHLILTCPFESNICHIFNIFNLLFVI